MEGGNEAGDSHIHWEALTVRAEGWSGGLKKKSSGYGPSLTKKKKKERKRGKHSQVLWC
jgi:hypothetical protein